MGLRQQLFNISLASATATLLFISLTCKGWECGGRIFSDRCQQWEHYQILGPLLLTACIIVALCGFLILVGLFIPNTWSDKVALFCAFVCTILTTSSVLYHNFFTEEWLPCLAAMAMGISLLQIATLTVEYNRIRKQKSIE